MKELEQYVMRFVRMLARHAALRTQRVKRHPRHHVWRKVSDYHQLHHLVCLRVHCPRGVNLKRVNVYFYSPTVLSPLTTEMHAQTRLNGLLITDLARRAQTDLDVKWR